MRILRCLPRPLYFLLLLLSLFSRIPAAVCYLQEYVVCRTPFLFRCGGELLNVSYPFTAEGRDGYCGAGEHYKLSCKDGIPVIEIDGTSFRVNRIDYEAGVLSISDLELAKEACPRPYDNATLDWSLFEYTGDDLNLTLHYNCTPVPDDPTLVLHEVPCLALPGRQSYFTLEAPPDPWTIDLLGSCSSATVVPLGRAAVESLNVTGSSSIQKAVKEGFDVRWTAGSSWCRDCLGSGGACGYNSSNPKAQICFCPYTWSAGACLLPIEKENKKVRKILIGLGAGAGGFLLACFLCILLYRRRKMRAQTGSSTMLFRTTSSEPSSKKDPEMGGSTHYPTHLFKYEELHEATNGFSPSNELGDGGFGTVYKGKLRDGRIVAVKRLYENNYKRVEQFMNEVAILNLLRHPNLVTLYGCTSRHSRELLLVYEYVPNGTVADHLHGHRAPEGVLIWPIRLSIAVETATALAYLHSVEPQIIHRDVKTNNILLDDNFHVKVADFGLSRLFPIDVTHVSTAPQGTPGYVDPEYHQCYQLTDKSDVYSFGVVLVELISSKPAVDITRHRHEINLASMAINKIQNGALHELVDQTLEFETDWEVRRMIKLVAELAFRCLQGEKEMRPSMEDVLEVLHGIQDCQDRAERSGDADHGAADDMSLLKNNAPVSPDSVMDEWTSRTTTPNASG